MYARHYIICIFYFTHLICGTAVYHSARPLPHCAVLFPPSPAMSFENVSRAALFCVASRGSCETPPGLQGSNSEEPLTVL